LERLGGYRWGSCRAYVGLEPAPSWLRTSGILAMGPKRRRKEQQRDYKAYVEEPLREGTLESPWERLQGGLLLGEEEFVEQMKQWLRGDKREQPSAKRLRSGPSWEQIVREVERVKGERWGEFRDRYGDWGRDLALYAGQRLAGMRLRDLAVKAGGVDYGSAAGALLRFRGRLEKDAALRGVYERLKARLIK